MSLMGCAPNIDKLKDKQDIEGLIKALEYGTDSDIRQDAIGALIEIGKPAIEPLIKALKADDWEVRKSAAWALGKIGDERAVEPLIEVLGDKDVDVRYIAAWALTEIGEPAVNSLIDVLKKMKLL